MNYGTKILKDVIKNLSDLTIDNYEKLFEEAREQIKISISLDESQISVKYKRNTFEKQVDENFYNFNDDLIKLGDGVTIFNTSDNQLKIAA